MEAEFGNERSWASSSLEPVSVAVNFADGTLFFGEGFYFRCQSVGFACRRRLGALDRLWSCFSHDLRTRISQEGGFYRRGLDFLKGGLAAAVGKFVKMGLGVVVRTFGEVLHLPLDGFAVLLASHSAALRAHGHTGLVHVAHEVGGFLGHAGFEAGEE